jgi:hypothetical protein
MASTSTGATRFMSKGVTAIFPDRFAPRRHGRLHHGLGADGYATWPALALSGSTRRSWLREVMLSLLNTLRRW